LADCLTKSLAKGIASCPQLNNTTFILCGCPDLEQSNFVKKHLFNTSLATDYTTTVTKMLSAWANSNKVIKVGANNKLAFFDTAAQLKSIDILLNTKSLMNMSSKMKEEIYCRYENLGAGDATLVHFRKSKMVDNPWLRKFYDNIHPSTGAHLISAAALALFIYRTDFGNNGITLSLKDIIQGNRQLWLNLMKEVYVSPCSYDTLMDEHKKDDAI